MAEQVAPADFLDLIETLRHEGFQVSIPQCVQAQRVLVALASEGRLSESPDLAARRVGPIFCRTPAQQLAFPKIFSEWLEPQRQTVADTGRRTGSAPDPRPEPSQLHSAWIALIPLAAAPWVYLVYRLITWRPASGEGLAIREPRPEGPTTLFPLGPGIVPWWVVAGALLLVAVLYAAMVLWQRYRGIYAVRREWEKPPELASLNVQVRAEPSFASRPYRAALVALAQRVVEPSGDIDPDASAVATAEHAGEVTPVYAKRRAAKRFLALVHQAHVRDHQARVFHAALDELESHGAQVERFVFEATPVRCRRRVLNAPRETLAELRERFADEVLLVCADTDLFFNAFSGTLHPWTETMRGWERRAVLVPRRAHGGEQRVLDDEGWDVVELEPHPLQRLAARLNGQPAGRGRGGSRPGYSDTLHEWRDAWVSKVLPGRKTEEHLLGELKKFLGPQTFTLLCACAAAYPELHWDITRHLARALLPAAVQTEALIQLGSLPWFRIGWMPTWFRLALEDSLTEEQRTQIQALLRDLIVISDGQRGGGPQLVVVPPDAPTTGQITWLHRLTEQIASRLPGRPAAQRPAEDYVTLMFLFGRSIPRLAAPMSDDVRHAIRTRNHQKRRWPWPSPRVAQLFVINLLNFGLLLGVTVGSIVEDQGSVPLGIVTALAVAWAATRYMAERPVESPWVRGRLPVN